MADEAWSKGRELTGSSSNNSSDGRARSVVADSLTRTRQVEGLIGYLHVEVERATELSLGGSGYFSNTSISSPYVKLQVGPDGAAAVRTKGCTDGGCNPMWAGGKGSKQKILLPLRPTSCPYLDAQVLDEGMLGDSLIGKTALDLSPILLNPTLVCRRWHAIWPETEFEHLAPGQAPLEREGQVCGKVLLVLRFEPMEGAYWSDWPEHVFEEPTTAHGLRPGLCSLCGMPVLPLLSPGRHCVQCGEHAHAGCLAGTLFCFVFCFGFIAISI